MTGDSCLFFCVYVLWEKPWERRSRNNICSQMTFKVISSSLLKVILLHFPRKCPLYCLWALPVPRSELQVKWSMLLEKCQKSAMINGWLHIIFWKTEAWSSALQLNWGRFLTTKDLLPLAGSPTKSEKTANFFVRWLPIPSKI